MASGLQVWSQTAASNATADSAVNYAEGMAPSALNDSARGLMASMAKWRDDINGTITTGGSSTAYTVTSNQTQAALTAGYMVAFVPHTTNGATVTLNVDSLGAKPLRSAPGSSAELPAGVLVQGTPYVATYYTSSSGEWILHAYYGDPYGIPIGGAIPYLGATAPNSYFVLPYGQAVSRTTYSALFSLVSTTFGTGDGSTTFNLPDIRGRTIFGRDNMGGSTAGRITNAVSGITGTTIGATGGAESVTLVANNIPTLTGTLPDHTHQLTPDAAAVGSQINGAAGAVNLGNSSTTGPGDTGNPNTNPTISVNSGSPSSAVNKMPPAIILPFILRIL